MKHLFIAFSLSLVSSCSLAAVGTGLNESSTKLLTASSMGKLLAHYDGSQVLQLTVPNQFSMALGGSSCGYQALYNGLCSIKLAQGKEFSLTESREALFCSSQSPWRKLIIDARTRSEGKEQIQFQIASTFGKVFPRRNSTGSMPDYAASLGQTQDLNGTTTLLWNAACNVTTSLSKSTGSLDEVEGIRYTLSSEDLKEAFKKECTLRAQSDTSEYRTLLTRNPTYLDTLSFNPVSITVPYADSGWLTGDEMLQILKTCGNDESECPVFWVGDSMDDSMSLEQFDKLVGLSDELHEFRKKFQTAEGSHMGLFMIRKSGGLFGQPHWYSVLAHKIGNERQYLVTDSSRNASRLQDTRFVQLTHYLEGKPEPTESNIIFKHPFITSLVVGLVGYYLYTTRQTSVKHGLRTQPALLHELGNAQISVVA